MASDDFIATILANGQKYTAWESVMVRRDFSNGISVFEFSGADASYGPNFSNLKLAPSDTVEIYLGDQKAVTGAVTTRSVAFDDRSKQIVIAGRSKTQELWVSSAAVQPGTFDGYTFEQAARAVMAPHGVGLVMQNPPAIASKPFPRLCIQYGETCAEFISRMALMRGMFIIDDVDGNLVVGDGNPSSPSVAELVEGRNILRATGKLDDQAAVGVFASVAQHPGDNQHWPPRDIAATLIDVTSNYPNRLRLFVAEHPADAEDLVTRVQLEAVRTSWPKVECSVTVVGWFKPDGTLWKPTQSVSIFSPSIFPTQDGGYSLAIQSCTFAQDNQNGTTTVLELVLPNRLTASPTAGIPDIPSQTSPGTPAPPDWR